MLIIGGGPSWTPLGDSSGSCFAPGCGYTGWIHSSFTIATAGNYLLEAGVVNWNDQAYDSGLALDGVTVGGTPITPPTSTVPEPASLLLLGLGGAGLALLARRARA